MYSLIQPKDGEKASLKPVDFVIAPETVHKLKSKYTVPNFKITGKLNSLICSISKPFTGEVCTQLRVKSLIPYKSVLYNLHCLLFLFIFF